jgi:hypothetical protein
VVGVVVAGGAYLWRLLDDGDAVSYPLQRGGGGQSDQPAPGDDDAHGALPGLGASGP